MTNRQKLSYIFINEFYHIRTHVFSVCWRILVKPRLPFLLAGC